MRSSGHRVKPNIAANGALSYVRLSPPTRSFMLRHVKTAQGNWNRRNSGPPCPPCLASLFPHIIYIIYNIDNIYIYIYIIYGAHWFNQNIFAPDYRSRWALEAMHQESLTLTTLNTNPKHNTNRNPQFTGGLHLVSTLKARSLYSLMQIIFWMIQKMICKFDLHYNSSFSLYVSSRYVRKNLTSCYRVVAWTMLEQHCYHAWAIFLNQQCCSALLQFVLTEQLCCWKCLFQLVDKLLQ